MEYTRNTSPRQPESGNHKRRTRRTTDLSQHSAFGREYRQWRLGGNEVSCFIYEHHVLGEVLLRFNQGAAPDQWTAKHLIFGLETYIPHQPPAEIREAIEDWLLTERIEVSF